MSLTLRPGRPEDATRCGTICYEAFTTIAEQHNFPTNYPSPAVAIERMVERLTHPGLYAVVAELDGRVVGSNFLDERSAIAGLGPITVAPTVQNRAIGRHLMQDVLERVAARHSLGVRLVLASSCPRPELVRQAGIHCPRHHRQGNRCPAGLPVPRVPGTASHSGRSRCL